MQNRASAKATQPQLQYRAKKPTGRRISCPSKDETPLLPRESHTSTLRAGLGVRPGTAVDWEAGLPGPLPTPQSEAVMPWMRELSRATVSLPSCSIPCTHLQILSGPTLCHQSSLYCILCWQAAGASSSLLTNRELFGKVLGGLSERAHFSGV